MDAPPRQLACKEQDMKPDFESWDHATLAKFAEEVYERLKQTQDDLKAAMAAYRELLRKMDC